MDFALKHDERDLDSERIFFHNLSPEAQTKALEIKGIKDHRDENWDIFPLVYHYEAIHNLTQQEIDDEALCLLKNELKNS